MYKKVLTDVKIRSLEVKDKLYDVMDGDGLMLRVAKSGTKTWIHRYTIHKKITSHTLGHYPALSISKARRMRDDNKELTRQKIHPKYHIQNTNNSNKTFKEFFYEWYEFTVDEWTESTAKGVIGRIEKHILPYIGSATVSSIDADTVIELFRKIERKGILDTSNKIRSIVKRVFEHCLDSNAIESNSPLLFMSIRKFKKTQSKSYPTFTSQKDIAILIKNINNYDKSISVSKAIKLAPHLGLRPGELAGLRWNEVGFDSKVIRIPEERMKMKRVHLIPMSDLVFNKLKELYTYDFGSEFVFPSTVSASGHITPESLRKAIRSMGYNNDEFTTHSLRSIFSTRLHETGKFNSDAIELQLAHSPGSKVKRTYNYAQHLNERKNIMKYWSDYLYNLGES
jgi:integrase